MSQFGKLTEFLIFPVFQEITEFFDCHGCEVLLGFLCEGTEIRGHKDVFPAGYSVVGEVRDVFLYFAILQVLDELMVPVNMTPQSFPLPSISIIRNFYIFIVKIFPHFYCLSVTYSFPAHSRVLSMSGCRIVISLIFKCVWIMFIRF